MIIIGNDTFNDAKRCKSNPNESIYIPVYPFYANEDIGRKDSYG